jgi:hypothetical protein
MMMKTLKKASFSYAVIDITIDEIFIIDMLNVINIIVMIISAG